MGPSQEGDCLIGESGQLEYRKRDMEGSLELWWGRI